jgi:ATP-dependent Clp protease ATP-binding subunit ClpA
MYERFTDRARKVMQLANQEAQRFRHEYIGTEHILLGLISEGSGVAANVLKNLDIDLLKVRIEVEKIVQHGPNGDEIPMGRLPHTPRTKKVIEYAIEEARSLHHNYVGTEHLLLGLLREQDGDAALVLMNLGLKLEDVREEVLNLLGHNTGMIAGAAPERPEEDVFRIAKSLKPGSVEPYAVSDEPVDDPPGPAELTPDQLQMIHDRIRHLTEQKEVFAAALDFALAARCRNEADALRQLLAWYERGRGTR